MYKIICLVFLLFFRFLYTNAQSDSLTHDNTMWQGTYHGLATGVHVSQYPMLELGYSRHTLYEFPMTFGGSYTVESYFLNDFIFAPKVNYWCNIMGINAGFSVPWYFDLNGENSLRIRPEIGFGYDNFKVCYSANIALTNKNMEDVGTHFLSLNYYIRLKQKE